MGGWPLLVRVALSLLITNITFLFINNFLKNTKATLMVWKNIIKYIVNVALLFFLVHFLWWDRLSIDKLAQPVTCIKSDD